MAGENGNAARDREETPLLQDQRREGSNHESEETLTSRGVHDEERVDEDGKANQLVGTRRIDNMSISKDLGLIEITASNISIITTTQSRIAGDLDAFANANWFTSTYLIAMSSMSPVTARLAQIFSPRNCIIVASILLAIGGIVTSQAKSLTTFLIGRAISGIGGAGILTMSFILVLELSAKKKRGLFIGLVNTGFTSGVSLGAVIAGALLPVTGWRPLFGVQSPLALIFGVALFFSIPKSFTSGHKNAGEGSIGAKLARIDYLGAFLLTGTIVSFLFGLSFPKVLWIPIAISALLLPLFVFVEVKVASDPIIPVTVLRSRGALFSCVAQLGIMAARWMVLFYTPVFAIAIRGWSPASAGSILIPTNLGFAIGGVLVGWLHIKHTGSFWQASIISYFLFAFTFLVLSQISNPNTPAPLYLLAVFINGACTGAALNYTLAHMLHLTPPSTHYISTSLLATFRGFAGSFGSAIGGGLFVRALKSGLETGFEEHGGLAGREDLVRRLLGSPALVKTLRGDEKMVAVNSYVGSLQRLLLSGAGLALCMVLVQAAAGWKKGELVKEEQDQALVVSQVGSGRGVEDDDEDWEEGLENGV
ncbi:Efflux pump [Hyphodiscus hymeniophilus]|uniref:Efflux pump n=1 Tax=Hyphodiscus hymeniophilus TaxID=353542 RepID=A0A9P6VFK6_9HELO|nr:Efflux pump [Hyphodiscus hymeniophilus]